MLSIMMYYLVTRSVNPSLMDVKLVACVDIPSVKVHLAYDVLGTDNTMHILLHKHCWQNAMLDGGHWHNSGRLLGTSTSTGCHCTECKGN